MFVRPMARMHNVISVVTILFALAGCSFAEMNSIFREPKLDDGKSLVLDAKQRVYLNTPNYRKASTGTDQPERIICAEPSPDVSQALSSAISAAISTSSGQGATGQSAGGNFGFAAADSIAQLGERLAVVQLLRDKMYRACEAYANGAIGPAAYTLMMARNDKTMTALLSSEMAAGAFGRALAQAGAAASVGGVDPAKLEKAKQKVIDTGDALTKAPTDTNKLSDFQVAVGEMAGLVQAAGVGASGASGAGSIGTITGRTGAQFSPDTIHAIFRDYVDDDGTEPLIDSCLVAMAELPSSEKVGAAAQEVISKETALKVARGTFKTAEAVIKSAEVAVQTARDGLQQQILSTGNLFAAFCASNVLVSGSQSYFNRRHEAEKELRILGGLDNPSEAEITAILKALEAIKAELKK